MTDYENNYKYIAEAWINNGEEEDFKASFLTSLLLQWQGHGHGFNADMLDGHHYSDIAAEISTATNGVMKNFTIGDTAFNGENTDQNYKIDLRAVTLYPEELHLRTDDPGEQNPGVYPWDDEEDYINTGWYTDYSNLQNPNPDLFWILAQLYQRLSSKIDEKANQSEVDELKEAFENAGLDELQESMTPNGINAFSVNGLRFFVKTPAQYEQVPPEQKKDIHNVFIIKDPEDLAANGMETYDQNPDIQPFHMGYEFDVLTIDDELWLVYRVGGNEWKQIAKAADFIDPESIEEAIRNVMGDDTFVINKDVLKNSLVQMDPITAADENQIPLTKYVKDNYIYGGEYQTFGYTNPTASKPSGEITLSSTTTDVPTTTKNGYKYLSLQNPFSSLKTALDKKLNKMQDLLSNLTTRMDSAERNNQNLSDTVNTMKGNGVGADKSISDLNYLINDNSTSISGIKSKINDLGYHTQVQVMPFNKFDSGKISILGGCYKLPNCGFFFFRINNVCHLQIYMSGSHSSFNYKITDGIPKYVKISTVPIPNEFRPFGGVEGAGRLFIPAAGWTISSGEGTSAGHPSTGMFRLENDGHIYYANTLKGSSTKWSTIVQTSYLCNGGPIIRNNDGIFRPYTDMVIKEYYTEATSTDFLTWRQNFVDSYGFKEM